MLSIGLGFRHGWWYVFLGGAAAMWAEQASRVFGAGLSLSAYPWRSPPETATLTAVSGSYPCRCALICPWTGQHGAFRCLPATTVSQVRDHFANALLASHDISPVWPCIRANCLTFVPQLRSPSVACVATLWQGGVRAAVLPRCLRYSDLLKAARQLLGDSVNQVRMPPALLAKYTREPRGLIHLRDGDLLDILSERPTGPVARVSTTRALKDHCLWTRSFVLGMEVLARLWFSDARHPVMSWIPAGTTWKASDLTFDGSFCDGTQAAGFPCCGAGSSS